MVFYQILHAGVNIYTTQTGDQRYLAGNSTDSCARTAFGTAGGTGAGKCPTSPDTQRGMDRPFADQFDLWRFHGHRNERVLCGWAVGVQIAHITTIHKAIQPRKDSPSLFIGDRERPILSIRLDAVKLIFDVRLR